LRTDIIKPVSFELSAGECIAVGGPSGAGKGGVAAEFLSDGGRHDDPGISDVFGERPNE